MVDYSESIDGGRVFEYMEPIDGAGELILAYGACFACGALFSFNPTRVPSILVRGEREPICQACMERVNDARAENGRERFEILPGAYEPATMSQLVTAAYVERLRDEALEGMQE